MYGETIIANIKATRGSGGGIELSQSSIKIQGICIVSQNYAMEGGGIYATSSTITVHQPGALQFINNSADIGGGMYLGVNPRLNLLISMADKNTGKLIKFSGNRAIYGGAVYVADDTSSAACLTAAECFIQSLALYQFVPQDSGLSTYSFLRTLLPRKDLTSLEDYWTGVSQVLLLKCT